MNLLFSSFSPGTLCWSIPTPWPYLPFSSYCIRFDMCFEYFISLLDLLYILCVLYHFAGLTPLKLICFIILISPFIFFDKARNYKLVIGENGAKEMNKNNKRDLMGGWARISWSIEPEEDPYLASQSTIAFSSRRVWQIWNEELSSRRSLMEQIRGRNLWWAWLCEAIGLIACWKSE